LLKYVWVGESDRGSKEKKRKAHKLKCKKHSDGPDKSKSGGTKQKAEVGQSQMTENGKSTIKSQRERRGSQGQPQDKNSYPSWGRHTTPTNGRLEANFTTSLGPRGLREM